jgi:hypothetical protein
MFICFIDKNKNLYFFLEQIKSEKCAKRINCFLEIIALKLLS